MRIITDQNSFYWQTGPDGETWLPEDVTNANRVNDDAMNFSDSWYWQDQETGNAGAFIPVMSTGTNWLRIGPRETMAEADESPRFDVVCLKNFGPFGADGAPDEADVLAFIATPVEPKGKLAATWADVKMTY